MSRREDEWRDEIDSHLAMRAESNAAGGMSPEDAANFARRQFGNRLGTLEDVRAAHISVWLDNLLRDIRIAFRGFRRSPAFSFVAIATLAIGIGASTAVLSAVQNWCG
jgi:hypothetical protein